MHTFNETGSGSVPAFLLKLWRLVEDKKTNHLIHWTTDGNSFVIQDQAQFARELLPLNYKHNNMASFIRQLNMYGFHKISSIDSGGLKFDKDEMEFSHPCFIKDSPYLLENIKRKIATHKVEDKSNEPTTAVNKVLNEVKSMRGTQENFDSRLSVMKQENEALWREIASLRQKHMKQQQIVNKLIQFLVTLVQPTSRNMTGVKRQFQLMINDTPHSSENCHNSEGENNGPVIHELTEELLEATDDPDLLTTTPNVASPGGGTYRIDIIDERPSSNASYYSNYDEVNAMDDEAINLIEQQPTTYTGNAKVEQQPTSFIVNSNSPTIPGTQYVAVDQQFVDESGASNKKQRRRKAATTEAGTSKVAKIGKPEKKPVHIKTEQDLDQLFMIEESNKKNPTNPSLPGDEYITSSFLSNDVPNEIFEEQSQPSPVVGGFDLTGGNYNDKIDMTTGKSLSSVTDDVQSSDNSLQLATVPKGKVTQPKEVLRLNSMDDVNSHLDGVQENLDSLKDILMGEGYSLDTNALLGWDNHSLAKLFNDSEILNPYNMSLPGELESGIPQKELTYEPFNGDLTDMLVTDNLNYSNENTENANKSSQPVSSSVLNTPLHE